MSRSATFSSPPIGMWDSTRTLALPPTFTPDITAVGTPGATWASNAFAGSRLSRTAGVRRIQCMMTAPGGFEGIWNRPVGSTSPESPVYFPAMTVSRRTFVETGAALAAGGLLGPLPAFRRGQATRVVVVGGGAFGGWTAWYLLKAGMQVTLLDPWGPGNSRSSSSGETRIFRATYGLRVFTQLAARALT